MEALLLILIALVIVAVLIMGLGMYRLRFDGHRRKLPIWAHAVYLVVVIAGLAVSVAMRSWWNVATFAALTVTWTLILIQAVRTRRSGG